MRTYATVRSMAETADADPVYCISENRGSIWRFFCPSICYESGFKRK